MYMYLFNVNITRYGRVLNNNKTAIELYVRSR